MGCGGSKGNQKQTQKTTNAKNDEPHIDSIDVPDTDPSYPSATPPKDFKKDIFTQSMYTSIDNKAKQVSATTTTSYESLIKNLTTSCRNDLEKLRAIFVWIFHQNINDSFYNGVTDPYTPRGYMKLIKQNQGSYVSFFAQLCRSANIPCVVVRGVGKGSDYDVGQQDVSQLRTAWNAAYVEQGWRLIHPLWAYFMDKNVWIDSFPPRKSQRLPSINEFFWLVDPERMICFCKPDKGDWQLLHSKWDHQKFVKSPLFFEHYFTSGLKLPKRYNAIIYSDNGLCIIDFDYDQYEDVSLKGIVEFNQEMSSDEMPASINLDDYVISSSSSSSETVLFKIPVRGRYNLRILDTTNSDNRTLVEFRIECSEVHSFVRPFPFKPENGLGISPFSETLGISNANPDSGIIYVKANQEKIFRFETRQRLEVKAVLDHPDMSSYELIDFIVVTTDSTEAEAHVIIPDQPVLEFGLTISGRPYDSNSNFVLIGNYLLVDENWKKKTAITSPRNTMKTDENAIRKALVDATNKESISDLESAIDVFEYHGLPDNGDLTRAKHKLLQLHLQNLQNATKKRKLEDLENAIKQARMSLVKQEIIYTKEFEEAEAARRQLKRLSLYLHKILELKQSTISEIHSYNRPRPLVHSVMKATFRILGEPQQKIQKWTYIQNSMRQVGRNSVINRMRKFDIINLKKKQASDAEEYLNETNQYLVRMCSAGAGTFYVWSNNIVGEKHGKKEVDPLEIFQVTPKDKTGAQKSNVKWKKTQRTRELGGNTVASLNSRDSGAELFQ